MKSDLCGEFDVAEEKVSVIPFGVNSFLFQTGLSRKDARTRLGLKPSDRVLLFFGNIAPYKGVDLLVEALARVPDCRLIIAGPVKKGCDDYWRDVERAIDSKGLADRVIRKAEFIPDGDVEVYFKAADAAVLPYKTISQSGVLFVSLDFGVPVIATGVGGLAESIEDGVNGFTCRPGDAEDLARTIAGFFKSELFRTLEERRDGIIRELHRRHSWDGIGAETCRVYTQVARAEAATERLCAGSEAEKER
jgi:glycosyltransferase involved in cell wall biosynthesis